MTSVPNQGYVSVEKTTSCSFCGEDRLTWLVSRSGKPYLAKVEMSPSGALTARKNNFHRCPSRQGARPTSASAPHQDRISKLEGEVARIAKIVDKWGNT